MHQFRTSNPAEKTSPWGGIECENHYIIAEAGPKPASSVIAFSGCSLCEKAVPRPSAVHYWTLGTLPRSI
jgi:hypothetical protein